MIKFHGFASHKKCMLKILITNGAESLNLRLEISFKKDLLRAKLFAIKFLSPDKNP